MPGKVLVANRGEIACRILRTLRRMRIPSVAIYSEADAFARHAREADEAVCVGGPRPVDSYLRADRILDAARQRGADAIHPGYGFLSENAEFARACEQAGIRFIGPTSDQIREFGLKHRARQIATAQGVPILAGTGLLASADAAVSGAASIGYPVILKSTAGGGGIGLRVCRSPLDLTAAYESVARVARANFSGTLERSESSDTNLGYLYLEKYLERARHVEVQIFGDGRGAILVLGERDCSVQRRNQKVIEETPAPGLSERTRGRLFDAATRMGRAVHYRSAGTVEFVLDAATEEFFFLEVNTRLQVEHGVTEAVTGIDLVEWMIREAAPSLSLESLTPRGAAIEVRLYAEDPAKDHRPSTGTITDLAFDPDVRVDSGVEVGGEVTPYYDPLLAKVISHGATRSDALAALERALGVTRIAGIETNLAYLRQVIASPAFRGAELTTALLSTIDYRSTAIDVIQGGTQTTVQDAPGRIGLWAVGVPPSGPMDDQAFCVANRIVGNRAGAAALELTVSGPTLRFRSESFIALTGARMQASLDGEPVPFYRGVPVRAGSELKLGGIESRGVRAYLAVRGGLDVPTYLGSQSTFLLGRFGGHGGRALRTGDVLHVAGAGERQEPPIEVRASDVPLYPDVWQIGVLDGPHGAPDFFTEDDIDALYGASWRVHHNSDRTGVRLIGPKPRWARQDGGEAGLHPSNIHDNAYAVGAVDYTGDMPVILGPDGPSLGGFVCPITIARGERWKVGQLKAGDTVRFVRLTDETAQPSASAGSQRSVLAEIDTRVPHARAERESGRNEDVPHARAERESGRNQRVPHARAERESGRNQDEEGGEKVVYRRNGDDYLLVEYGPPELDIGLRLRAHALMEALERRAHDGIIDLTPGIRSLQVHYDPAVLSTARLLALLRSLERDLPRLDEIEIPTRVVHMPLSWEDPATLLAIERYMRSVRPDAPWCPSNIEFIRRINGLASVDDVRRIVFGASYLVLGLGDVYLGAPVATPLDPRHRLVTTKYNPARTWTPENAVGIGGAYLCIYGMEGPGGYQFVGRTLQVWNTHAAQHASDFGRDKPYLLRFFDEIRFEPVEAAELLELRKAFLYGKAHVRIEESAFRYSAYCGWLEQNAAFIAAFKKGQQAAFDAERERWRAQDERAAQEGGEVATLSGRNERVPHPSSVVPEGCSPITSPVAGSIWQIVAASGAAVGPGTPIVMVEAMKMEIAVVASSPGTIERLLVSPGESVLPGQVVAFIRALAVTSVS
jgi:urea carboxylase